MFWHVSPVSRKGHHLSGARGARGGHRDGEEILAVAHAHRLVGRVDVGEAELVGRADHRVLGVALELEAAVGRDLLARDGLDRDAPRVQLAIGLVVQEAQIDHRQRPLALRVLAHPRAEVAADRRRRRREGRLQHGALALLGQHVGRAGRVEQRHLQRRRHHGRRHPRLPMEQGWSRPRIECFKCFLNITCCEFYTF